ncbi:MAG: class I SAM-dependent methyltransferase [Mycobacteriales bacterium]
MTRSPFDNLVDHYDAGRPSYPQSLYDALETLSRPLAGARVVECGAGTGIATRELLLRGARLLALDLSHNMLRRNGERTPGLRAAVADAHALPIRDDCADLVCFAAAWHWMAEKEAATEIARVLRPGGALAVWWNNPDADHLDWFRTKRDMLATLRGRPERKPPPWRAGERLADLGLFSDIQRHQARWERRMAIEDYLVSERSFVPVAELGDQLPEYLRAVRGLLVAAFPDGIVTVPYTARLWVARL